MSCDTPKGRNPIEVILEIESQCEAEDRYWRGRGEEPSKFVQDTLAKCVELRAAGALPKRRLRIRYVATGPDGTSIEVTAEERAALLRAGAKSDTGDA